MRQEIFCYVKGKEQVHFLNVDGSLEAYDILVEFVDQVAKISGNSHRDILHTVAGKLQTFVKQDTHEDEKG